jgi:rfaE bifunctional protein nucleotidyltransferase chain/domain
MNILHSYQLAKHFVEICRSNNKKIIWTNGCYDLFHYGHVVTFNWAKSLEQDSILIVGVNSDNSVRRLKGPDKPIIKEGDRVRLVACNEMVDAAVIFREETPIEIIREIVPDVIVKGTDYKGTHVVGSEIVNGRVEFAPLYNKDIVSTRNIIKKIREMRDE